VTVMYGVVDRPEPVLRQVERLMDGVAFQE